MDLLKQKCEILSRDKSDINEHLPTLYKYALECNSVFETGVRGVISSYALLYGLMQNKNNNTKKMLLNDITQCNLTDFLNISKNLDISINYVWKNNLEIVFDENETYDLVFIDTWHIYGQLKRELIKFSKITNKYIIMHDTEVDKIHGETIRCGWNAIEQSKQSGFTVEEINKGLEPAITEFLLNNSNWKIKEKFTNNNGLTILEKIDITI